MLPFGLSKLHGAHSSPWGTDKLRFQLELLESDCASLAAQDNISCSTHCAANCISRQVWSGLHFACKRQCLTWVLLCCMTLVFVEVVPCFFRFEADAQPPGHDVVEDPPRTV